MDFFKKGLSKLSAAAESAAAQARAGVSGAGQASSSARDSSRAGNSGGAGGGGLGLGADGADPTSLPDVRFDDRDSNESHVQFLWTVFEGAPESSTQQDDALESFLDGFNSCFDGWFPPPSDGSNAPGGGGSLVGCAVGHPTAVLRGLVTSLRRVHAKLEAALALGASGAQIRTDGPDALQRAAGLASLHACVVATRSAHNRAWLIRLGLLDALTALLKLAMQRLNVLGNLAGMRQPGGRGGSSMGTAAEVATQLGTLELLCAHGASVLSNFLDADLRFGSLAGGCGMDASPGTNAPSSVINRGAVHSLGTESPAVKPLLECGGLTALVEMIRIQRLLRSAPTGSEGAARSLEGLLLRTLGAALAGSAAAQHSLRGAGGLEMLIEGMGDVAIGGAIGTDGTDARLFEVTASDLAGGDGRRISAESLELGTTALDVVRRAVKRNGQNVKHAVAAGAFGPRLCAMLRRAAVASAASLGEGEGEWAGDLVAEGDADAFFAVAAKDVRTRPPGTQLRRVFDVLWAFIAGEGKESGGPGGDSGSSGSRPDAGSSRATGPKRRRRRRGGFQVGYHRRTGARTHWTHGYHLTRSRTGARGDPRGVPDAPRCPARGADRARARARGVHRRYGESVRWRRRRRRSVRSDRITGWWCVQSGWSRGVDVRAVSLPGGDLPASGLLLLRRESRRRRGEGRGTPAATRGALHSRARVLVPSRRDRRRTRGGCVDPAALARFPVPRGCVPGGSRGLAGGGDGGG